MEAILPLLEKGLELLPLLVQGGIDITSTIGKLQSVIKIVKDGGKVPQDTIDQLHSELDDQLTDFNKPMA